MDRSTRCRVADTKRAAAPVWDHGSRSLTPAWGIKKPWSGNPGPRLVASGRRLVPPVLSSRWAQISRCPGR